MKIFKRVLIVLAMIIALPLIIALFVDADYNAERSVIIDRPKTEVFNYIRLLKNQDNYSKWATMDPKMEKFYTGTDGTVGFVSAWKSLDDNVGAGEQEIKRIQEGSRIDYELRFIEPFESVEETYMTTEAISANQTRVTWGFNGNVDYPMSFMMLFMDFEKMIGDDLGVGLTRLKSVLEKQQGLSN